VLFHRAYKTELDPNNAQRTLLRKHAGTARFAWNWALARIKDKVSKPNAMTLSRELNAIKGKDFPWMYEVSKCSPQEALRNLHVAFQSFFKPNKSGKKSGFPRFKFKHDSKQSFKLTGTIKVEDKRIKLPRLGWLRLKEHDYVPKNAKILSATCSEHAGKWFVSVSVQEEIDPNTDRYGVLGIDLGIRTLATCSDGTVFENPKALKSRQKQLKKLQKRFSRRKKGSKRREKTRKRIAKLHYQIGCIRKDAIHKATTWVAKTKRPEVVVLEDLNVKGMLQNRKLSLSISDASFHEFRVQVEYKQKWGGGSVLVADRFYPSSKTCSNCGAIKEDLKLSDRVFACEECCMVKDRDLNASENLEKYGTACPRQAESASSAANARGGDMLVKSPDEARIKQQVRQDGFV
jgi:putative transposase